MISSNMFLCIMYSKSRVYLLGLWQKWISGPVKNFLMAFKNRMLSVSRWQNNWPLLTFPQFAIGYQILLNYGLQRWALFINLQTCHVKVLLTNYCIASDTDSSLQRSWLRYSTSPGTWLVLPPLFSCSCTSRVTFAANSQSRDRCARGLFFLSN